jgi:hypothetical protein
MSPKELPDNAGDIIDKLGNSPRLTAESALEFLNHPGFETEPVVVCGLLRFVDAAGAESFFEEYWSGVWPFLHMARGRHIWSGRVSSCLAGQDGEPWEFINLFWYPSRKSLMEIVLLPAYLELHQSRTAGIADSRQFLLTPAPLDAD